MTLWENVNQEESGAENLQFALLLLVTIYTFNLQGITDHFNCFFGLVTHVTPDFYCLVPCNSWKSYQTNQLQISTSGILFDFTTSWVTSMEISFAINSKLLTIPLHYLLWMRILLKENELVQISTQSTNNSTPWKIIRVSYGQASGYYAKINEYISPDEQPSTLTSTILVKAISKSAAPLKITFYGYSPAGYNLKMLHIQLIDKFFKWELLTRCLCIWKIVNRCPSIDTIPNAKWKRFNENQGQWSCEPGYTDILSSKTETYMDCQRDVWTGQPLNCTSKTRNWLHEI